MLHFVGTANRLHDAGAVPRGTLWRALDRYSSRGVVSIGGSIAKRVATTFLAQLTRCRDICLVLLRRGAAERAGARQRRDLRAHDDALADDARLDARVLRIRGDVA
jgi:hypothetical protein